MEDSPSESQSSTDAMMQDLVSPVPRECWYYPSFGTIVDTIRCHITDRPSIDLGDEPSVYTLEEGFLPKDRAWMKYIQNSRIQQDSKVLYRPNIVKTLCDKVDGILTEGYRRGLMIIGPPGVGKSHSLVNLTRYLLASKKYVVTIIPDCSQWESRKDFFTFLLESVGVNPALFGLDCEPTIDARFEDLIDDIDKVLSEYGRQWVFVFDQINAIFARDYYKRTRDVRDLELPFSMITRVLKPGRIISIISVSANNDMRFRLKHEGFKAFEHPTQLDIDEIMKMYPPTEIAQWNWEELEYATGRVPWYLSRWAKEKDYIGILHNEIKVSLDKLKSKEECSWKRFVDSAIQCVLHSSSYDLPVCFDLKFSLVHLDRAFEPYRCRIVALFPLVEDAYRDYFWDEICTYTGDPSVHSLKRRRYNT